MENNTKENQEKNGARKPDLTKIDPSQVTIVKNTIKPLGELDTAIDPDTGLEVNIKDVRERVDVARGSVHAMNPCFGALLEYVNFIYTFDVPTQATDGTRLFINPTWTNTLTDGEIRFVMIHELLHCVFNHLKRGRGHDKRLANVAADFEVNGAAFIDKFVNQGQLDHIGAYYAEKYTQHPETHSTDLWSYEMIYNDVVNRKDLKMEAPLLDIVWPAPPKGNSNTELVPSSAEFKRGFADAMHKINEILEQNYRKMSKKLGDKYTKDDVSRALENSEKGILKIRKTKQQNDFQKLIDAIAGSGNYSDKEKNMLADILNAAHNNGTKITGVPAMGFMQNTMGFGVSVNHLHDKDDELQKWILERMCENKPKSQSGLTPEEEEKARQLFDAVEKIVHNYDDFNADRDIEDDYKTYEQGWDYAVDYAVGQIANLVGIIAGAGMDGGMSLGDLLSQMGGKQFRPALPADAEDLNIPRPPHYELHLNSGKGGTGDKTKRLSNEDIISQQEGANIARKAGYKGEFTKEEELDDIESKWEELSGQMAGKEGSELITRHLKDIEASRYNWQHELRKLMNRAMSNSLKFRNEWGEKRGLARDTMTLKHKTNNDSIKDVVFLVDCSGSISDKTLSNLLAECYAITKKCNVYDVTYAYFTTRVELVETTNSRLAGKISDAAVMLLKRTDKHAKGGHITGGTDFKNALDWVSENGGARCVVMFTDGYDEVVPKPHNVKNLIWGVYDNPEFKSADNSRVVYLTTKNE